MFIYIFNEVWHFSRFTSIASIYKVFKLTSTWLSDGRFLGKWFYLQGLCLVRGFTYDAPPLLPSGSWRMRLAGSRRPWRRRPRPNCPCPSLAECPGTARPRLLATPAVTWRLPSRPQSPPPPPSAAAHLQVRQVCVCVLKCVSETKKDGLLLLVEWMEVLKLTNAN